MSVTPIVELRFGTTPYYDVLSIEIKKKKYNFINVFFFQNCYLHVTAKRSGLERKLLISYVTSSNSIKAFIFLPFQNVLNIFS